MNWYYYISCKWQNWNLLAWFKHLAQKSVYELDFTHANRRSNFFSFYLDDDFYCLVLAQSQA